MKKMKGHMLLRGPLILLLVFCFLLSASCSLRKPATAITADMAVRGMSAIESEDDLYVAKEAALPLIKMLEVLYRSDPSNKKLLGLLAKVYGNYAFGFAELEAMKNGDKSWGERAVNFYGKGKDYGIKALSSGKNDFDKVPMNELPAVLRKFGKKDSSKLFWTAFDWGSYINLKRDDITEAANLPRIEAMIDRVIEIDPWFNCGSAYAFKGAIIAGNPLRNGGRPETAEPYFQKAFEACDGKFLMNRVMYAEWYLRNMNDEATFKSTLAGVISADAALLPSQRLANELAKERARVLLNSR